MSSVRQLIDYISDNNGNVGIVNELTQRFSASMPTKHYLPVNCPHIYAGYKSRDLESQIIIEITRVLFGRDLIELTKNSHIVDEIKLAFGCDISRPSNFKPGDKIPDRVLIYFLLQRALCYDVAELSTCEYRVSYAGIKLFQALTGSGIKLYINVNVKYSHHVLNIGSKDKGWYVYDPLTNPELIFEHKFYVNNILPMFRITNSGGMATQLEITSAMASHCEKYWQSGKSFIEQLLKRSVPCSTDNILRDPNFLIILSRIFPKGLEDNKKRELIESAISNYENKKRIILNGPANELRPGKF